MPRATIEGIQTRYEVLGDGPPLVMFSPGGFDASLDKWSTLGVYSRIRLLEHLPRDYTCIVFDRRETGESGGKIEHIGWTNYVAQGRGLLKHLGFDRAHLFGGCMGCSPVLAWSTAWPDEVLSMTLFWPVGGARYRIRAQQRYISHLAAVKEVGLAGIVDLARTTKEGFGKNPSVGPWAPVIRSDDAFARGFAAYDVERYMLIVNAMARTLIDRDSVSGAEPEDLLRLDIPTLIVPGDDVAHARSAAYFLHECLPPSECWDIPPADLGEDNVPPRILEFLGGIACQA